MTDQKLDIYIDTDKPWLVGSLYLNILKGHESGTFIYAPSWLDSEIAFAISPALPLTRTPFSFGGINATGQRMPPLPAVVRDGSPDRWGRILVNRLNKLNGKKGTTSEVDYLLALDDRTRIGALRYQKPEQSGVFLADDRKMNIPPIIQLSALNHAANAVLKDRETSKDLKFLLGHGSPVGGARPKSVVVDSDGQLYIAKFSKPDDTRNIAFGEILCMSLAKIARINAASAKLTKVDGQSISIIKRFDRNPDQNRFHFMSAMTMIDAQEGQTETYISIANAIRQVGSNPDIDLPELWSRMAFGVLVSNLDDHLRNHGFLHDRKGLWRLSPAYDINPVPRSEREPYLETWIDEDGPEASIEKVLQNHIHFGLTIEQARSRLETIAQVCSDWHMVAKSALHAKSSDIDDFASAFDSQEIAKALKLSQKSVNLSISPGD